MQRDEYRNSRWIEIVTLFYSVEIEFSFMNFWLDSILFEIIISEDFVLG